MTSSRADCTLAGARLISSASRKLWNTGPSSVSNRPVSGRHTRVPTRSAGTRSGVNWMRPYVPPSEQADEQALEHRVLADDDALDLIEHLLQRVARLVSLLGGGFDVGQWVLR